MSTPRSSVLVPLTKKSNVGTYTSGILNPSIGTSLSSTPSPTVTPSFSRSLNSLGNSTVPSLSPSPSPLPVSSSLIAPPLLPLIDVGGSPIPIQSSISKSLDNLRSLPPSPRLGNSGFSSGSSSVMLPPISLMRSGYPASSVSSNSSVANLRSLPPPRLSNLGNSGFDVVNNNNSITLPMLPVTPISTVPLNNVPDSNLKPLSNEPTIVSVDSPSSASFHNYQGMIQDKGVEQTLTESGYLPVDKILTRDENGNLMCQYIKAIDATGRSAFIDLDTEGYVAVDPKNMTMTTMSNASVVPYSVKMGTYECASSDVCGVAFECDNEICTLKRNDNSLTPSETVFTSVNMNENSGGHKAHGMLTSHPIAYPIVALSDIKANPDQVVCSIKDSHNRMRNVSFDQAKKDTETLVGATDNLNNEIKRYEVNHKIISSTLAKTIRSLETIHEQYKKSPPANDFEKTKLRSVYYNLRKRHDMVVDHLKLAESVNSRVDRVNELTGEVRSLNNYAEKLFAGMDGVYQE